MTGGTGLPRLTKPQMARLVEIGRAKTPPVPEEKPATSASLVNLGLAEIYGRRPNAFVTVPTLRLTPLGIRILAGVPGPEFDRFRVEMESADG